MAINFAAANAIGLNNPGTEIITLVQDGSGNFINPPSYDKVRAYLRSGEVPMLFVTTEGGETGSLYQLADYSETENKIRFSNDKTTIEFSAGSAAPVVSDVVPKPLTYDYMPEGYPKKSVGTLTLMEEQEVHFREKSGVYVAKSPAQFELLEGHTYTVVWDGTEYNCVCLSLAGGQLYIGNVGIFGLEQTNEPFLYGFNLIGMSSYEWVSADSSLSHTIKVIGAIEEYSTMDSAYIHAFNANDEYVSGLPTPAQILDQEGIDAIVGKTTLGEIKNNTAVFSYVFYGETNLLKLRPFGITQEDGTQIWQYAGVDVQRMSVCTLEFCFNGSADDSVLTNVNILYPSAMYIKSSTTGSTKNFKITVDDSGTISATEVT